MDKANWIGPLEVAERLDISLNTVYAWCQSGRIKCRRTPTGRYRIRPEDLTEFEQVPA